MTEYLNDVNRENTEVLAEIGMDGAVKKAYTYGEQRLSVDETGADGSSSSFYLYDARGSVSALSQKGGTLLESYQYDPFGQMTFGTPADVNAYGYNAESYNKTTGLLYLRARHYDTETGRFLTEDGYLGTLGNPMSRNRYAYGEGNPLGNVDPSGHSTLTRTIGTAVGMAVSSVGKMAGQVLSTAGAKAKETAKKAQDVAAKYSKSSSSIVRTVANTMRSTANAFQKQAGAYNAMAKTARNMDKVVANVKATLEEVSKRIEASFEEATRTARLIREPVKINGFYFINGENVSRDEFEAIQKRCAEDIARIQFQQNFTKQDTGKEALAAAGLSVLDGAEGLAHLIFQALDGIFHQNGAESLDTLYHNVSDQFRFNTVTYDAVYGLSSLAQLAGGIIGAANAGGAVASNIKNWITGGGTRTLVSGGAVVQGLNLDVALEGVMIEDIAAIFDGLGILNSTASKFEETQNGGGFEGNPGTLDTDKIIDSASQPKKGGETVAGHALQKHAGRNPDIWGKVSGNSESINNAAMQHIEDILNAPEIGRAHV